MQTSKSTQKGHDCLDLPIVRTVRALAFKTSKTAIFDPATGHSEAEIQSTGLSGKTVSKWPFYHF